MRTVPLQQICDIQIGKTPSRSVPEYWGGELPWVTISDFAAGRIVTTTQERITRIGAAKSGSKRIPRGTLLLSFKLSLGKRALSGCDLFTNEAIAALHVLDHDVADRDYLYWALGSIDYDRLVDRAAKGKTLNKAKLKILKIPLPPLAEQKRIAAILDAADALRAKRREALAQLDTLLQSTFLDMFGDPISNPMGWDVTTVDRTGSIQGGLQVTSKRLSLSMERPYLRVANVFRGFLELDELKTIRLTEAEELRTSLEYEDILIVEGHGNKEEIGRCARWDGSIAQCVHQNHLIRLRCDRLKASPIYVENYINSPGGRRSLTGTSRTTSGLNTISVSKVRGSEIQLPPLDLQHRFAAIVESVEHQKAIQRAHLAELDTLFASLQSRAFRGEL